MSSGRVIKRYEGLQPLSEPQLDEMLLAMLHDSQPEEIDGQLMELGCLPLKPCGRTLICGYPIAPPSSV